MDERINEEKRRMEKLDQEEEEEKSNMRGRLDKGEKYKGRKTGRAFSPDLNETCCLSVINMFKTHSAAN